MPKIDNIIIRDKKTGTQTVVELAGGGGGSAEPIIKTPEQTDTGMTITFTEDELAQIQNNLGTVVKVDMGDGEYLPLSPAYSRLNINTMHHNFILCCEIVEYNAWYKFVPTEDPLVFALDPSDMSSPFGGGGNATDTAYQFFQVDLMDYDTTKNEFIPVGTILGLLDVVNVSVPDCRKIVLSKRDTAVIKQIMTQFSLSTPPVLDDISIADFYCATKYVPNFPDYMIMPVVIVPSFVDDDEELANGIKNGTYSFSDTGYELYNTDTTIFTYKGVYGGLEYTLEARPLYQKLSSSNSHQQTDLYAIVVASVSKGNTYIQNNDASSVEDFKNIINGNYASVFYTAINETFGNIIYKTSDTYVCEVFGDFTTSSETGYTGVLKVYLYCTYNSTTNTVSYKYYQNIASSVIANPKSGELNDAISGGTLTQLLVNDKVYDIASGGGTGGTTNTAYVEGDTLYISSNTTAGGGSANDTITFDLRGQGTNVGKDIFVYISTLQNIGIEDAIANNFVPIQNLELTITQEDFDKMKNGQVKKIELIDSFQGVPIRLTFCLLATANGNETTYSFIFAIPPVFTLDYKCIQSRISITNANSLYADLSFILQE